MGNTEQGRLTSGKESNEFNCDRCRGTGKNERFTLLSVKTAPMRENLKEITFAGLCGECADSLEEWFTAIRGEKRFPVPTKPLTP